VRLKEEKIPLKSRLIVATSLSACGMGHGSSFFAFDLVTLLSKMLKTSIDVF
jgi:hypothetical protein